MADSSSPPLPRGLVRIHELDAARAITSPAARVDALRRAAPRLRERIGAAGKAVCVRTFDMTTFPYPTRYGLGGAASSPAPFVMMRNRMQLVQVEHEGEPINILVNPTDAERSLAAPFFARQVKKYGRFLATKVLSQRHSTVEQALREVGVRPDEIDYVTFDHLHVQDLRGLLGTDVPEPGKPSPTRALLPRAKLLAQAEELRTLDDLHPLQVEWYVRDGMAGVPVNKIVALRGDYLVGGGLAIVRTPGHTEGNHSLVLHTDSGLWAISENGIAVEAYVPEQSRIPGVRRFARGTETEVVLNSNTRENTLDQYGSMVLEKALVDPSRSRPEFPQFFPSSELTRSALAPGLVPTFTHRQITHGAVRQGKARSSAAA